LRRRRAGDAARLTGHQTTKGPAGIGWPPPDYLFSCALPLHRLGWAVGIAAVPPAAATGTPPATARPPAAAGPSAATRAGRLRVRDLDRDPPAIELAPAQDRKSTRLNSSHGSISYAVF